jgi:hypothetical protein
MKDDLDGYRRAYVEISDGHDKRIEKTSGYAFEYGVLAIKDLLLVSGGALSALIGFPAIAGLSDAFEPRLAALAGLAFGAAVALSVICIYAIRINWLSHFHVALWARQKAVKHACERFLHNIAWAGESEGELNSRIKRNTRVIGWTFVLPHILGVIAFIFFVYGAFRLYQSVGL